MSDQAATVERIGVEPIPSRDRRPRPTPLHAVEPAPPPAPEPPPPVPAAEPIIITRHPTANELIQANFNAIARILAVRLLLLLALLGAFVLALGAMAWQTPMGLGVLIAWSVLSVLPMTWLEFAGRFRRGP